MRGSAKEQHACMGDNNNNNKNIQKNNNDDDVQDTVAHNWRLVIQSAQERDTASYLCQVITTVKMVMMMMIIIIITAIMMNMSINRELCVDNI